MGWTLAALLCLARAGQLQLFEGERWRELARAQNAARTALPASRGGFFDRAGRPLAVESVRFRAYLAPDELRHPARAVSDVRRILGLSAREAARLRSAREGWVVLPRAVTSTERDRLQAAVRSGLHFERLVERAFPEGPLARPLLGAVAPDGRGRSGLELALDSILKGEPGVTLARRDALGGRYRLPDARVDPPEPGLDVYLTLDAALQRIAEDALERALRETGASGGDVLMLDPHTGEILALASRTVDGLRRVPAFTDAYEPGSTLKPLLLASLLQEGLVELGEWVDTGGGILHRNGRTIRDVHPEDSLTVADVVRTSSNVGAARLADRLRPGLQYRYLRDFGLGTPTGVLYPAESAGRLRKPDAWSALSRASLAMGYEVSVTSLQLAAAYGALANGGVLMRPYLLHEVRSRDGKLRHRGRPEPIRRIVSRDVARRVTEVLSRVVAEGTGSRAALATLPVAGKTGTARIAGVGGYETGRYAASFVGYTPVEDPSLVILTKLDDPQGEIYGGQTAAPISRLTLQAALATRGVVFPWRGDAPFPSRPVRWGGGGDGTAEGTSSVLLALRGGRDESPAGETGTAGGAEPGSVRRLPDLRGLPLRTAVARLHDLGLRVRVVGRGRISGQTPPAGARVRPGETVVLR